MAAARVARCVLGFAPAFLLGGPGCATAPAVAPAPVQHVVLVKLVDPADAAALLADCRARLADIPGVASCVIGQPLDTGRSSVDGDYDAALVMGFASTADYQRYLEHPAHVALVDAWKPRWLWIRIHDFAPR